MEFLFLMKGFMYKKELIETDRSRARTDGTHDRW